MRALLGRPRFGMGHSELEVRLHIAEQNYAIIAAALRHKLFFTDSEFLAPGSSKAIPTWPALLHIQLLARIRYSRKPTSGCCSSLRHLGHFLHLNTGLGAGTYTAFFLAVRTAARVRTIEYIRNVLERWSFGLGEQ